MLVVTVKGELDADVCPILEAALHVRDGLQPPRIVLDLHGLTFMDSSGVNLFANTYQMLNAAGGWLRIAAVPAVERVLNLVGLDTVITCHPTLEDALNG
ncbi:STAS domain-containing protein [Streptomyces sp. V3I8]|uniref:STAS domain-containing protein n=1 Tax=Streptomyces sp. V3I8 TaxID=3042279 RepID=UPI0027D900F1|nr:STAS domain-containing protein [Streptomyces sp. V3I8]